MANFYALLIGIDYYQPNPHFNSLRGAVRDIDKVAAYLDTSLKIPSDQITRLTSPLPDTNSNADVRAARQEQPPTYQNIVNAFKGITEGANTGDLVYIHYSGHGGRVKSIYSELKGDGQFDECLVPMDVGEDGYYLRDVEMNTLLKRMTDKGLIVTVIFDSCHSGGATRGDGDVRGARDGQVDTNDRPLDSTVADRAELLANWLVTTQDSDKHGWLPNRKDYVFLGACRPTELAYEAAFDAGTERNGALTYWMLDTLNSNPTGLTYQALYDRVKGQVQSRFPNQLPMLLGQGDRLVFGSEIRQVQYSLTVVQVGLEQVTVDGGLAQGLSRGARFALYPVGNDFTNKLQRLAVVEITEIQAATATAKILSIEECGVAAVSEEIEPGLPAVMESASVDLQRRVRFYEKTVGDRENELSAELAAKQTGALEKVRQVLAGNGWIREVKNESEEGHYQVAIGRAGEYEISRLTPIHNLNPALNIDTAGSPAEVVKRLIHLAKYQAAQDLDNSSSELTKSIEYELLDDEKRPLLDPNNISLKSGDRVYLRLKNISSQPLSVAILDFEATWEISQIPIQGNLGSFYSLQAQEETFTRLRFQIPDGSIYQQAKESLKLFVTRGLANFQWLILPSLDRDASAEHQAMRGVLNAGLKAENNPSPLSKLLSTIGADVDTPPPVTRAVYDPDPNAEWLTKSILLTVKQ
jgi:Caspase domain